MPDLAAADQMTKGAGEALRQFTAEAAATGDSAFTDLAEQARTSLASRDVYAHSRAFIPHWLDGEDIPQWGLLHPRTSTVRYSNGPDVENLAIDLEVLAGGMSDIGHTAYTLTKARRAPSLPGQS